MSVELPN